ncbi:nuclear receptor coactivator 7 isoform X1 [Babesia caballi]|uniref:Nuclear receptor coactivator 7 isoform X1 n=1 Tax=Babesia caballi TaxID=5871 RepID=A0AAV4LZT9_BABCB|nr:nuclear receptor coactivator 7 isoform X1 [Babesia caballi]
MEVSQLAELQQRLSVALVVWDRAPNPREKARRFQDLLDRCEKLVSAADDCPSAGPEIRQGLNSNILRVAQLTVKPICVIPRGDAKISQYRSQAPVLAKLLSLVAQNPSEKTEVHSKVLFSGLLSVWRLAFAQDEGNVLSSAEAFRRSSLLVDDVLQVALELYCRLRHDNHVVQVCSILLEVLLHSSQRQHQRQVLEALADAPPPSLLAAVYPGLIARIIVCLPTLWQSNFECAMRVIESWVDATLACDCAGARCECGEDAEKKRKAEKTSEAIVAVFERYSHIYIKHLASLTGLCLRCWPMTQEAMRCAHKHLIKLLKDKVCWDDARRVMRRAPTPARVQLWLNVMTYLRNGPTTSGALAVYVGYVDLQTHVPGLEPLDEYLVLQFLYDSVELPEEKASRLTRLPRLAMCGAPLDMSSYAEPKEEVYCQAAACHISRMTREHQAHTVSGILESIVSGVKDAMTVGRMLMIMRGFFNCGVSGLRDVASDVIDVLIVRILKPLAPTAEVAYAALSLLCAIFSRYRVVLPCNQVCDLLFFALPLCVVDSERVSNCARALLRHLSVQHTLGSNWAASPRHTTLCGLTSNQLMPSDQRASVEAMLLFYKNLLVSRCERELKHSKPGNAAITYHVADVLFVLLNYKLLGVKDLFDLTLRLEKRWNLLEAAGRNLGGRGMAGASDANVKSKLPSLYCYAFIAHYLDDQFGSLELPPILWDEQLETNTGQEHSPVGPLNDVPRNLSDEENVADSSECSASKPETDPALSTTASVSWSDAIRRSSGSVEADEALWNARLSENVKLWPQLNFVEGNFEQWPDSKQVDAQMMGIAENHTDSKAVDGQMLHVADHLTPTKLPQETRGCHPTFTNDMHTSTSPKASEAAPGEPIQEVGGEGIGAPAKASEPRQASGDPGATGESARSPPPADADGDRGDAICEASPPDSESKDRRLAVATIIATRCRYHLGAARAAARGVGAAAPLHGAEPAQPALHGGDPGDPDGRGEARLLLRRAVAAGSVREAGGPGGRGGQTEERHRGG